ncbi:MAG: NifU family protein [Actinomycetota bacterium]
MTIAERPAAVDGSTADDGDAVSSDVDEFERLAACVDTARAELEDLDDDAARVAADLADSVEAFHRPALVSIVRTLRDDPRGKELLFQLVDDPHVRAVFALHGIIRADPATRAERALDTIRPYLSSHGGGVELVSVAGSVATVRLVGSCNGCSMSTETLRATVAEALTTHVDEITSIDVAPDEPAETLIPVSSLRRRTPAETGWVRGPLLDELGAERLHRVDVPADDHGPAASFVVTRAGGTEFHVFVNACVHQGLSLDGGLLGDGLITCPWHGFTFDAASGECVSSPGAQLDQVPSRVDDDHLWIRARTP